jgi:hypothetical protein
VWDVKPDPVPRSPVKVTDAGRRVPLGSDFPTILTVPSTPSPFLASGLNDFPQHKREIWNLETMEKTGEIRGLSMTSGGVLSPDGAYLAGKLNQANLPFVVISCKDGSKVLELDVPALTPFDFLDFAGPRRLIIGVKDGNRRVYHLYEVPGGRKLREVETPAEHEDGSDAISAGGRYLAFKSGGDVLVYDLDQGRLAGKFTVPGNRTDLDHLELTFSPSGKELAVLFESVWGSRVFTWNLEANRLGVDHTLPSRFVAQMKTQGEYHGRHLEWLGDDSG